MFLIFYSGTVFWLHCWGYLERSPPPTFSPKTAGRCIFLVLVFNALNMT